MRVVSLLPSATETVCALGRRDRLVGRSEECDYPDEVRSLPVVMRARTLDASRPSAEIDARVRAVRGADESLYTLDVELLAQLAPEVVLTQDLCRVCSVTDEEVVEACRRADVEPRVVSLTPRRLDDVWESIRTIGAAVGARTAGDALADRLRRSTARPDAPVGPPPRVAVLEWIDPPILAGLWVPDIVVAAGGEALGGAAGEPGVRVGWGALAERSPDLVVVAPCSFGVPRTREEIDRSPSALAGLAALRPRWGTWLADEAFFSRPGPRLSEGVALLRSLVAGRAPAGVMPAVPWSSGQAAR